MAGCGRSGVSLRAAAARYHIWRGWPSSGPCGTLFRWCSRARQWAAAGAALPGRPAPLDSRFGRFRAPTGPETSPPAATVGQAGRPAILEAGAQEHHVQRARGQESERQRDPHAVAGGFQNRRHGGDDEKSRPQSLGLYFSDHGARIQDSFTSRALPRVSLRPMQKAPAGALELSIQREGKTRWTSRVRLARTSARPEDTGVRPGTRAAGLAPAWPGRSPQSR